MVRYREHRDGNFKVAISLLKNMAAISPIVRSMRAGGQTDGSVETAAESGVCRRPPRSSQLTLPSYRQASSVGGRGLNLTRNLAGDMMSDRLTKTGFSRFKFRFTQWCSLLSFTEVKRRTTDYGRSKATPGSQLDLV